jgi:regulator of cell morphogenesis and NO signaling
MKRENVNPPNRSNTMATIDLTTTIGQLVTERPHRARVFERFGIDYCCGGKRPLGEVCAEQKVNVETLLGALREADAAPVRQDDRDWSQATLAELIEHIMSTHHACLNAELPRLAGLLDKVFQVHSERHAELRECRDVFQALKEELDAHMQKEEMVLFPLIAQMEGSQLAVRSHCGSVKNPIHVMEMEHDSAGAALARMRSLTRDYEPPTDACNSYRALLGGLAGLEADLHRHVHKENNVLFPRAIKLEAQLSAER